MGAIEWNASLMTGIAAMDEQHQRLIEIYNELDEAMLRGTGHKQMREILNSLIEYTELHFSAEEEFMASVDYKDLERHAVEHGQLLDKVKTFQQKLDLDQERITKPVMKFLEFWLCSHIQGKDMEYAKAAAAPSAEETAEEPAEEPTETPA